MQGLPLTINLLDPLPRFYGLLLAFLFSITCFLFFSLLRCHCIQYIFSSLHKCALSYFTALGSVQTNIVISFLLLYYNPSRELPNKVKEYIAWPAIHIDQMETTTVSVTRQRISIRPTKHDKCQVHLLSIRVFSSCIFFRQRPMFAWTQHEVNSRSSRVPLYSNINPYANSKWNKLDGPVSALTACRTILTPHALSEILIFYNHGPMQTHWLAQTMENRPRPRSRDYSSTPTHSRRLPWPK